jgi:alkanesulfonate monooxygenase SsuD/methylene tetrahydromethanopterin reductase-like flavin-dependent oxidoreductase (luciferase family)
MWTDADASYEGRYYTVAGAQCDPKPVQQPRPPVLLGGAPGPTLFAHIAEYADGWIPVGGAGLQTALVELRRAVEARGRDFASLRLVPMGVLPTEQKLDHYRAIGIHEAVLRVPSAPRDQVLPVLDGYTRFLRA